MRKIQFAIAFLSGLISLSIGQSELTLSECYQKARSNHPLGLQQQDYNRINELNKSIISGSWFPQISLDGKATYQSDVVSFDIDVPNMGLSLPEVPKDQYNIALEIKQLIYDGGVSKSKMNLERISHQVNAQQIEVELYTLHNRVNHFFFQVFILKENLRLVNDTKSMLDERIRSVTSAVENGALLESDLLQLKVERLKVEQRTDELQSYLTASTQILELLIGESLENKNMKLPEVHSISESELKRPEMELFKLNQQKMMAAGELKNTFLRPKIAGFGHFGYGQPGLNMLSDQWDTYYIIGVSLSWKLWDWRQVKKEQQVFHAKANLIDHKREAFQQTVDIEITSVKNEVSTLEQVISKDDQIIEMQNKIVESAASKLDHGVITSDSYVEQLNKLTKAKIERNNHQVQLKKAIANYNTLIGVETL